MDTNQEAKDRYHIAKLALFNVRLLGRLQGMGDGTVVRRLIVDEATRNGMNEVPSLLHQATFLQFSYICLVWLWESAKRLKLEKALLDEFTTAADTLNVKLPDKTQISGERKIGDWPATIRLLRNALGHGRVDISETSFVFSDQDMFKKPPEKAPTLLEIGWEQLAKISEAVIHALTPVIWPKS